MFACSALCFITVQKQMAIDHGFSARVIKLASLVRLATHKLVHAWSYVFVTNAALYAVLQNWM